MGTSRICYVDDLADDICSDIDSDNIKIGIDVKERGKKKMKIQAPDTAAIANIYRGIIPTLSSITSSWESILKDTAITWLRVVDGDSEYVHVNAPNGALFIYKDPTGNMSVSRENPCIGNPALVVNGYTLYDLLEQNKT